MQRLTLPSLQRTSRRRPGLLVSAALIAGLTLGLGACGDDDESEPATSVDGLAEFDDSIVVGLPLADAEAAAESAGWQLRVIRIDGEDQAATADLVDNRVNIATVDGVVTEVISIG